MIPHFGRRALAYSSSATISPTRRQPTRSRDGTSSPTSKGYTINGDYRLPNPPARIVDALAHHDIDVAIVWGPLAGYFATREPVRLALRPVSPQIDMPFLPFVFDISMGVRRSDSTLAHRLDSIIVKRRPAIDSILAEYGVPRVDAPLSQ